MLGLAVGADAVWLALWSTMAASSSFGRAVGTTFDLLPGQRAQNRSTLWIRDDEAG
jgi:hypothetical protein